MNGFTLGDLAVRFGLELRGDAQTVVDGVCALAPGRVGGLSYLAGTKYRALLESTLSTAVIVGPREAASLPRAGLIAPNPELAYARIAALFDPDLAVSPGIHPSACIAPTALIGERVFVGANAVIDDGAVLGADSYIGPGCVVGRNAHIGEGTRLVAQVHVGSRVRLGRRCRIEPGAVIGSRGFGNARGPDGWEAIPQLGSVVVGDDVEIGANTCIDRGTINDTVIGNGVRLDNLIQVAHNCSIGEHTAIAACTGMAGSTRIGARCMIAGAVGIGGHLEIVDDVVILGMAMVTKSLPAKGVYGSGVPVATAKEWHKQIARMRRLDVTEARLRALEMRLGIKSEPLEERNDD
ncbi:MAG: UDP-3-O-(3-hydroxymyristoyl)glucosamine N-acyltransferase [Panacagrimonas sp.]